MQSSSGAGPYGPNMNRGQPRGAWSSYQRPSGYGGVRGRATYNPGRYGPPQYGSGGFASSNYGEPHPGVGGAYPPSPSWGTPPVGPGCLYPPPPMEYGPAGRSLRGRVSRVTHARGAAPSGTGGHPPSYCIEDGPLGSRYNSAK